MSRTLSKEKYLSNSLPQTNEKTEKKRQNNIEFSLFTKSTIWLNNLRFSLLKEDNTPSKEQRRERMDQAINKKFLKITSSSNLRINRARILDWYLDVCRAFQLRWETYWCAVEILDYLIFTIDCVRISNIHIMAVACLFMATKIHQYEPPLVKKLVQKAVYDAFSYIDVLRVESEIIIACGNHEAKPRYLQTINNSLYELYPKMPFKDKIQVLRRLVLVWMDPAMAFKIGKKRNTEIMICYKDIVKIVVKEILEQEQECLALDEVKEFYSKKYECENLERRWPGFDKITQ